MSQKVRITYYGMDGAGRNLTEAKQDAGRKIEASLAGDYNPVLLSCRSYQVLIYREPGGWCFLTVATPNNGPKNETLYGCPNYKDRYTALRDARTHLAQIAWQPEDGELPPIKLDRSQTREFSSWATFQLRYQDGITAGLSQHDAHAYAGKDPSRPELWILPKVS